MTTPSINTAADNSESAPLIQVRNLKVHFPVKGGLLQRVQSQIKAVDGVSFDIARGKTVGLVGESGSGKTTCGRAIAQLLKATSGSIHYDGKQLFSIGGNDDLAGNDNLENDYLSEHLSEKEFFPYRKRIQIIFQDPFNSLNPRMRIENIIAEPLEIHFPYMSRDQRRERIAELLVQVGLEAEHMQRFPHQFSGGQRQRIGIARALAVEPEFIICDEPVSALDVSVQAQIVNLLQDLQEALGLTYLFIAHDLAVVEHISDWVMVMTNGKIVEQADAETIYRSPQHPYTQKLLEAIPAL